jgi:hypothetical protein
MSPEIAILEAGGATDFFEVEEKTVRDVVILVCRCKVNSACSLIPNPDFIQLQT